MELIYTISEIEDVAQKVLANLKTKTILIYGEMGAGKTTLVKALVKALGSEHEANSPTYSIVNEYEACGETIYHFDLYRIKDLEEAYNFGIEDYLFSDAWVIIEWPDLVTDLITTCDIINITHNNVNSRNLTIKHM